MLLIFAKLFPFIKKRRLNTRSKSHNPRINLPIDKNMLFFLPITAICDHDFFFCRKNFSSNILNKEYISI